MKPQLKIPDLDNTPNSRCSGIDLIHAHRNPRPETLSSRVRMLASSPTHLLSFGLTAAANMNRVIVIFHLFSYFFFAMVTVMLVL